VKALIAEERYYTSSVCVRVFWRIAMLEGSSRARKGKIKEKDDL